MPSGEISEKNERELSENENMWAEPTRCEKWSKVNYVYDDFELVFENSLEIAWMVDTTFQDPRPESVSFSHTTSTFQTIQLCIILSEEWFQGTTMVIRNEISCMRRGDVTSPVSSVWALPVVNDTTRDGKDMLCVE